MTISNLFIQKAIDICDKSNFLYINNYDDHISYIYKYNIIKIYPERISVLYISDNKNHEEEIIKISDFRCYENIIDEYITPLDES